MKEIVNRKSTIVNIFTLLGRHGTREMLLQRRLPRGLGAAIGAIAGGGKGAAIGALAGAGGGTAVVMSTKGKELEFAPEQKFVFKLQEEVKTMIK